MPQTMGTNSGSAKAQPWAWWALGHPGLSRKKITTPTQLFPAGVDNLDMKRNLKKKRLRVRSTYIPFRRRRHLAGIPVEMGGQRIVAMTLAQEAAKAVSAQPDECERLLDAAFSIGQWLADEGYPGQWNRVRPAAILRCLDFLPEAEQEQFLFSFVRLLGHGALSGQIPHPSAKRSLDEISRLAREDSLRAFARTTAAQFQPHLAS